MDDFEIIINSKKKKDFGGFVSLKLVALLRQTLKSFLVVAL